MIRATFSAEAPQPPQRGSHGAAPAAGAGGIVIDIALPRGWGELSQEELGGLYLAMARHPEEDIRWRALLIFSGLRQLDRPAEDGKWAFAIRARMGTAADAAGTRASEGRAQSSPQTAADAAGTRASEGRAQSSPQASAAGAGPQPTAAGDPSGSPAAGDGELREFVVRLNGEMCAGWLGELDWVLEPGMEPVRLDECRGARAVNRELHGVSFGDYLKIENLYQGFIQSRNPAALSKAMQLLYRSEGGDGPEWGELTAKEAVSVLTWLAQVKANFSARFRNLFRPSRSQKAPDMLEVMNCEIRALTGGDVTKEEQVLSTDCWRALTELDYKAKEAEDFKRQLKKK